jgi:hypothetical protein
MPPSEKRKRIELTEVERTALVDRIKHLSRVQGMNVSQVSVAVGISENTVKSILKWGRCDKSVLNKRKQLVTVNQWQLQSTSSSEN